MAESDWERIVRRPVGLCAVTGEELLPAEEVVTALLFVDGKFERKDLKASAFHLLEGPIFSYWKWRRPDGTERGASRKLDLGFLSDFFKRLDQVQDEHSGRVRWIVALLLLRKRILELVERRVVEGRELLVLRFRKGEDLFEVTDPVLTPDNMASIEDDLGRIFNLHQGDAEGTAPAAPPPGDS